MLPLRENQGAWSKMVFALIFEEVEREQRAF